MREAHPVPRGTRVACLRVPDLPLAAELRAHPELVGRPVVVAAGPGPRAELVALSPEAEHRGVRRFTSVAHARHVCAELCVRVASPALERAARDALLDAALSLSPRAVLAPRASGPWAAEACAFADAGGTRALFGTEAGFATALAARAERLGFRAAVAVASSQTLARVASRKLATGNVYVLAAGSESAFLAPLPLDVLDPDDAVTETLTRFGVRCVRDLLALPRRALGTRLGPSVLELVALARGETHEAPLQAPTCARLVEASDLEFAIDRLEPLAFVLQGLLSRLLARLALRRLACGALGLRFELDGGGRDARSIGLTAPTLDLRVLMRLVTRALEQQPPATAVLGVAVESEGHPARTDQLDLFRPAGPAPEALDQTLAELQALCGQERIGSPRGVDDHRPHLFSMQAFEPRSAERGTHAEQPDAADRGAAQAATLATRALRPPVPVRVRLVANRPVHLRSSVANGSVVRLAGPWRTTGGWWSPESRYAYDHFDVLTSDGTISRLRFDHVRGCWDIDAVYD